MIGLSLYANAEKLMKEVSRHPRDSDPSVIPSAISEHRIKSGHRLD
jgi:hypothetical protein